MHTQLLSLYDDDDGDDDDDDDDDDDGLQCFDLVLISSSVLR